MNRYTMEFTLTSDKMPEKSGYYACIAESKFVSDMYYSKELELFNVFGEKDSKNAIKVFAYAELPDWAYFPEWKNSSMDLTIIAKQIEKEEQK